jgi:hypothetical protein
MPRHELHPNYTRPKRKNPGPKPGEKSQGDSDIG